MYYGAGFGLRLFVMEEGYFPSEARSPAHQGLEHCKTMFRKKLNEAVNGENIIYVISEKEHLPLLPEGALRILVTADLELIKSRFAQRMRGNLPVPVANMPEKKHGCFNAEPHDIHVVSGETDLDMVPEKVMKFGK